MPEADKIKRDFGDVEILVKACRGLQGAQMGTEPVRVKIPDQLHELLLGTPMGEAVYDVKNIYRHTVSL
jgi:hypothetical protein